MRLKVKEDYPAGAATRIGARIGAKIPARIRARIGVKTGIQRAERSYGWSVDHGGHRLEGGAEIIASSASERLAH